MHRHLAPSGKLQDAQRVRGGELDRHIAADRRDTDDLERLGRRERHQKRHRVVLAGIGVDDDGAEWHCVLGVR